MVSEAARRVLAELRARVPGAEQPLAEERRAWEAAAAAENDQLGLTATPDRVGGVAGEWLDPPDQAAGRVVLYCHGGGYNAGSPRTHRRLGAALARAAAARVLILDYRLAPEAHCPAAVDDLVGTYRGLLDRGLAPRQIAFGGDSSGGGLALAAIVALVAAGGPPPAAAFALSPMTDLTLSGPTLATHAARDPLVTAAGLARAARWYLGGRPASDPLASPLHAELRGFPPILLHVGSEEVLLSDATRFVTRARAAGCDAALAIWPGMWHVWHAWAGTVPEADAALAEVGLFLNRHLARG